MMSTDKRKKTVYAFNICLEERKVPQYMRIAEVVPLFRKRDRNSPEKYRPISRLTSVSKLLEKLLHQRMVRFFQKNKLFSPIHFGFRSRHSWKHSISTFTEIMRTQIDIKLIGQACFIYINKAFDYFTQNNLLQKFFADGFREPFFE